MESHVATLRYIAIPVPPPPLRRARFGIRMEQQLPDEVGASRFMENDEGRSNREENSLRGSNWGLCRGLAPDVARVFRGDTLV